MEQSINQLFDIRKHQRENGGGSDINKGNQQQTPHDVKYLYGIPWKQKKAEKHLTEKHWEQKKEDGLLWEIKKKTEDPFLVNKMLKVNE